MLRIFIQLLIALILTLLLEYYIIVRFLRIPNKLFLSTNILTNVLANIIVLICDILSISFNSMYNRYFLIFIIEILVIISESLIYILYYNKKQNIKIVLFTIIANIISFYIGKIILNILWR